ncbi:MAG: DUF3768 domain-containing protein [Sphingomonadales bacterium]|nr:DUF3768 domain-containing protein [Sphingomonadales bacterium]MDE2569613.1 DUF3768 domain-containing protein [Sphingomonadales bacterium]
MATLPRPDRIETIARLNDRARQGLDPRARIVVTRNCLAAFCDLDTVGVVLVQAELLAAFRRCAFAADSPERDFAAITFRDRKVWMKIDYFDETLEFGSDDSADASVTTRVITILLPEDY